MAGVEGRVQLRQDLLLFSRLVKGDVTAGVAEAALSAGRDGYITAINVIDTFPSSLSPGKVGRVYTGLMKASMDVKVTQTGTQITIQLGWLETKKKYFLTQEYGGTAFGKRVTAMEAIAAGMETIKERMKEAGVQ